MRTAKTADLSTDLGALCNAITPVLLSAAGSTKCMVCGHARIAKHDWGADCRAKHARSPFQVVCQETDLA